MPELPEVETIVRGLNNKINGLTVNNTVILNQTPLSNCNINEFKQFCLQQQISVINRFGKYIHLIFKDNRSLVIHLRMTGKLIVLENSPMIKIDHQNKTVNDIKHIHIIFFLNNKTCVLFRDVRRFGTFTIYGPDEMPEEKKNTGIDPFSPDFSADYVSSCLKKRKAPIKNILLNQKLISGLGNIYANEALHNAGIHPSLKSMDIKPGQIFTLTKEIRKVLKLAIKYNGTSISDFHDIDEKKGEFQNFLKVYGREKNKCKTCLTGTIQKQFLAGRSTYYCPVCQK